MVVQGKRRGPLSRRTPAADENRLARGRSVPCRERISLRGGRKGAGAAVRTENEKSKKVEKP